MGWISFCEPNQCSTLDGPLKTLPRSEPLDVGWLLYRWSIGLASRKAKTTPARYERERLSGDRRNVLRVFDSALAAGGIFLAFPGCLAIGLFGLSRGTSTTRIEFV